MSGRLVWLFGAEKSVKVISAAVSGRDRYARLLHACLGYAFPDEAVEHALRLEELRRAQSRGFGFDKAEKVVDSVFHRSTE
jgi:hypothetical protein